MTTLNGKRSAYRRIRVWRTLRAAIVAGALLVTLAGCGSVVDPGAEQQFMTHLADASITVFPAYVRNGADHHYAAPAAAAIAECLTECNLGRVAVSDDEVPITSQWGVNQSRMFRESVADFVAFLGEHPVDTDYALLPEYLIGGGGKVVGVHTYVLASDGTCAYAIGLNSHHQAFNDVNPQSPDDCTTIIINVLRAELQAAQ